MKINKGPKKNQHKIENKKILIFKINKGHIENINAQNQYSIATENG